MTEQVWNFAGIEGGAGEIGAAVQQTDNLLDEGKQSLAALAAAWGGTGSEAYQAVQMRWDTTAAELNAALAVTPEEEEDRVGQDDEMAMDRKEDSR